MKLFKFRYFNIAALLIMSSLLSSTGCTQEKTYWILSDVAKINGEPMHGFTLSYMEEIALLNAFIIKDGDMLHIDYPEKRDIHADQLKSITNNRVPANNEIDNKLSGKLMDSVYSTGISNGILQIKFNYIGTLDDDKKFVVKYEKLTEKEYYGELKLRKDNDKKKLDAVEATNKAFVMNPEWKTAKSAALIIEKITDSIGSASISLPGNFMVDHAGSYYVNTIDQLKVGTLSDSNVHYKIVMQDDPESFGDANLFMVKAPADQFDMQRYLAKKNFKVIEQDKNSFFAVQAGYDDEKKSSSIIKYIFFKHFYKNGLHFIYLIEDDNSAKDLEALAKRHYVLMKNLTVK